MKVAITGSSGLIGSELAHALGAAGHEVLRVVRSGGRGPGRILWDPTSGTIDAGGLESVDAVVHLAGESIGSGRWTTAQKARILDSRVLGTQLIARTVAAMDSPPRVLASGSAIGFYGPDRGDEELTEDAIGGPGFLAEVVRQWEDATASAEEAGIRVAHLRSGLVLSPEGGAMQRMLLPFKLGLGGRIGSGRQYWSWISLTDEVAAIIHVLERDELTGPVNLTAPAPVTNAELTATLARVLGRPAKIPVPTLGLKGALGTELVEEMLIGGQRVLPAKLERSGYRFTFGELETALRAMLERPAA